MDKIVKAQEVDLHNWTGIKLQTIDDKDNKNRIEFLIDNNQNCCEDFGYEIIGGKLENLIGKTPGDISIEKSNYDVDGDRWMNKLNVKFYIWDSVRLLGLEIMFYCEHNGYYSHNVLLFNETEPKDTEVITL